ncbi:FkbM family methyltransferase, partial [Xanthobacter autotrophicus]|uniref:FkbM family methyltransferase n=1 Tax=Xanthobacter autotrophicus TaxID=280 RepID=UPI00372B335A
MTNPYICQLRALLVPERLTAVVDVGANPIDGEPPYKVMLEQGLCRVVGFEPQPDALARLNAAKGVLETYLPYAIGAAGWQVLHVCQSQGMTSLYEPDPRALAAFPGLAEWGLVISRVALETRPLAAVAEIADLDFLKMDLQGGELAVIETAGALLDQAVCVQAEVSLIPLYKGQPAFGAVDLALRARGFVPHMLAAMSRRMILPAQRPDRFAAINQIVEADAVYVRNFMAPDAMSAEQLKQLALVAHHIYRSYDLALNCVDHLAARGVVPADAATRYLAMIPAG